jgi:hypothetical protein
LGCWPLVEVQSVFSVVGLVFLSLLFCGCRVVCYLSGGGDFGGLIERPAHPKPWRSHLVCRYPEDQVPPRTSFRSRQKVRHVNHTLLRVINVSMNRTARGSSGTATCPADPAATCPADPAPAAQPGAAPGPPCVLRPQLPLPSSGQLRGRHVCPGGPTVGEPLK